MKINVVLYISLLQTKQIQVNDNVQSTSLNHKYKPQQANQDLEVERFCIILQEFHFVIMNR